VSSGRFALSGSLRPVSRSLRLGCVGLRLAQVIAPGCVIVRLGRGHQAGHCVIAGLLQARLPARLHQAIRLVRLVIAVMPGHRVIAALPASSYRRVGQARLRPVCGRSSGHQADRVIRPVTVRLTPRLCRGHWCHRCNIRSVCGLVLRLNRSSRRLCVAACLRPVASVRSSVRVRSSRHRVGCVCRWLDRVGLRPVAGLPASSRSVASVAVTASVAVGRVIRPSAFVRPGR
jgi:hypothetical protein